MTRWIDLYTIQNDTPMWLSGLCATAGVHTYDLKREALKVGGCGMDMGFALVYELSHALHGHETVGADAKKAAEKGHPHHPRADSYRAGYSLTHRWI